MKIKTSIIFSLIAGFVGISACSTHIEGTQGKQVTPETFNRAESDRYFYLNQEMAGGINKFTYNKTLTPLNEQNIVRMNRDTLYASALIDTEGGATLTFPKIPDGRYASVLILDNDHYALDVYYKPGVYQLPNRTRYIFAAMRVHVLNPNDPKDLKAARAIQDGFKITANSAVPFPKPEWDEKSLTALRNQYEKEMTTYDRYPDEWQGKPGEVNDETRRIAVAGGWGLLPNKDALYINYNGKLSENKCYAATYKVPENQGFWSITMYGADGFIKSEDTLLNSLNVKLNADKKSFVAYFGSKELCGNVPNRLDTTKGWNFLMRIYRAAPSVLNGSYTLPTPHEVTK